MTVFVDSSAWYALLDADDDYHVRARRTLATLDRNAELVTHNYVVVETLALVHRRLGSLDARRFITDLLPVVDIEWVQPSLHDLAISSYLQGGASFVDHVSFALMRARGISTAFAFDADFEAQGFELLLPTGQ